MDLITHEGVIEKIIYETPGKDWYAFLLRLKNKKTLRANGNLHDIAVGETLKVEGVMEDKGHGLQLTCKKWEKITPKSIHGIKKFLCSEMIKGIGPHLADILLEKWGESIFEIFEHSPDDLLEIEGIAQKKANDIVHSWLKYKDLQERMVFLQSYGITHNFALKIVRKYAENTEEIVKNDPYRLVRDIPGIGFKMADDIALKLGHGADSPKRISAGLNFILYDNLRNGHTCLPLSILVSKMLEILRIEKAKCVAVIKEDVRAERLKVVGGKGDTLVYLPSYFDAEVNICSILESIMRRKVDAVVKDDLSNIGIDCSLALSPSQKVAVASAINNKVMILTGGPGTGKSTISKIIIDYFTNKGKIIELASPTGRAAKRLTETTGRPAQTIHRLLEYSPIFNGFKRNEEHPLNTDVVLIDEFSMVDIMLFNDLLKALPTNSRLIIVGDSDQLPSVGPGSVLKDLIESGKIPSVQLKEIFRQDENSLVVENAHKINNGEVPTLIKPNQNNIKLHDFFYIDRDDSKNSDDIAKAIRKLAKDILPSIGYGIDDIQVLCPMKSKGSASVYPLNDALQNDLNPESPNKTQLNLNGRLYRMGDKVIQTKNNYDLDVFNGDIGKICDINLDDKFIKVDYQGTIVTYEYLDLDELQIAYALTIHKSQGSEYPVVIIPMSKQHTFMMYRNLFYTGVTRTTKYVFIVGSMKMVTKAVQNNKIDVRYGALKERLKHSKGLLEVKTIPTESSIPVLAAPTPQPVSKLAHQVRLVKTKKGRLRHGQ
jgi:exodeoxyribonuclease V alpha subunit